MTEQLTPPQTRAEFEKALRGLGFSRRRAREIAARGFHSNAVQAAEADALEAINKLAAALLDARLVPSGEELPRNAQPDTGNPPDLRHEGPPDSKGGL